MDTHLKLKCLWLCGNSGAGKTTLTTTYLDARAVPCLWYNVDETDSDPGVHFHYLSEAARDHSALDVPRFDVASTHDLPAFSRTYFRALYSALPERTHVVFDNVTAGMAVETIERILRIAIDELPDSLKMILVSREQPPPGAVCLFNREPAALCGTGRAA